MIRITDSPLKRIIENFTCLPESDSMLPLVPVLFHRIPLKQHPSSFYLDVTLPAPPDEKSLKAFGPGP